MYLIFSKGPQTFESEPRDGKLEYKFVVAGSREVHVRGEFGNRDTPLVNP